MLDWAVVDSTIIGDGEFILARQDDDWVVRVDERILMTNRVHDSEISLAEESIVRHSDPHRILVGGLGLGYTLRAVLDIVAKDAQVTVAEFVPQLVDWNREHIGHLNDHPLRDPRVDVVVGDVYDVIKNSARTFDVILLDVDNGPRALARAGNQRLYGDIGVQVCRQALRANGVLGVWSANPNSKYAQRLERFGFACDVLYVPARAGGRARHVLFIGER